LIKGTYLCSIIFAFEKMIHVLMAAQSWSCHKCGWQPPLPGCQQGLTEITQPCIHMCDGLFICQLYLLPDLLEEMDCKEDTPLTLPFALFVFPLTVDNSDMN
jgi:hypothetical protein